MVPHKHLNEISDPIEMLDVTLECAWLTLCAEFDISARIPEIQLLLEDTGFLSPDQAAQLVLSNMLLEITELVGRFSPWYRMPARAYGLISVRNSTTNGMRWMLAPEAIQKWDNLLDDLALAIEKNSGLLQAMILVDGLMTGASSESLTIFAFCNCLPPRSIQIRQDIIEKGEIICNICHQPFALMDGSIQY